MKIKRHLPFLPVLALITGILCPGDSAGGADLVKITAYPGDVQLSTPRDRQSVIVQALYSNGLTRDITSEAKYTLADPALAKLEGGAVLPLKDGTTELRIELGGKSIALPLTVKDAAIDRPISFKLDVMPVFMKAGCNTGSCHGAARGKDGFRLSLFGFDPDGDYHRLTRAAIEPHFHLIKEAAHLLNAKDEQGLLRAIRQRGISPDLVVIDTLARAFCGGNPDLTADMSTFVASCAEQPGFAASRAHEKKLRCQYVARPLPPVARWIALEYIIPGARGSARAACRAPSAPWRTRSRGTR